MTHKHQQTLLFWSLRWHWRFWGRLWGGGGNNGGDGQVFHQLRVVNGIGSGQHAENKLVAIIARSPTASEEFDRWEGDTDTVRNVNASGTFIRMTQDLSVRATFKPKIPDVKKEFQLTVIDGTGSGTHLENELVNIQANAPNTGMEFDRWVGGYCNDS